MEKPFWLASLTNHFVPQLNFYPTPLDGISITMAIRALFRDQRKKSSTAPPLVGGSILIFDTSPKLEFSSKSSGYSKPCVFLARVFRSIHSRKMFTSSPPKKEWFTPFGGCDSPGKAIRAPVSGPSPKKGMVIFDSLPIKI